MAKMFDVWAAETIAHTHPHTSTHTHTHSSHRGHTPTTHTLTDCSTSGRASSLTCSCRPRPSCCSGYAPRCCWATARMRSPPLPAAAGWPCHETSLSEACAAHRSITALKEDAPNTFLSAPADESIFCDDMVLRNDLGLQVVRGRSAYLEAFDVVRQASASSLVPLEVKEQVQCTFAAVAGGVDVRWRVPMRIGGAGGGANVELSGCSAYEVDARGRLRAHTLSDLRVNGRRLPSSALGAWLGAAAGARARQQPRQRPFAPHGHSQGRGARCVRRCPPQPTATRLAEAAAGGARRTASRRCPAAMRGRRTSAAIESSPT